VVIGDVSHDGLTQFCDVVSKLLGIHLEERIPLTDTGKSLMPAIMALIAWGKEHFNEVVTD
jgi:hypothetical protein